MGGFILRRSLLAIPVVIGAISILFVLFFMIPGDPVTLISGGGGAREVNEQTRANIEAKYGLDDPWFVQYKDYWGRTLSGDLGVSYKSNQSVNDIVKQTVAASGRLAFWAILIEVFIGIGAGILSAVRRYSFLDGLTTISTAAVSAIPVFVLGYLLQRVFGVIPAKNGWPEWATFPVQGIGPDTWVLGVIPTGDQWKYLVLPAITLASVSTAIVARLTRTTMLEVTRADYMRTALAKGLRERSVIFRHGLRNAMIPVVTLIGIDFATLFGSAILTETVFNWPGMGSELASALGSRDVPIVLGLTLVIVLIYVFINLLVDLSYAWFDPRIRSTIAEDS